MTGSNRNFDMLDLVRFKIIAKLTVFVAPKSSCNAKIKK